MQLKRYIALAVLLASVSFVLAMEEQIEHNYLQNLPNELVSHILSYAVHNNLLSEEIKKPFAPKNTLLSKTIKNWMNLRWVDKRFNNLAQDLGFVESVFKTHAQKYVFTDSVTSVHPVPPPDWSVSHQDSQSDTMLYNLFVNATRNGSLAIIKAILVSKKDLDTLNGDWALSWASFHGNQELVEMLLDYGANINHQDKDDKTALMYAALNTHHEVIMLLLDRGADTNYKNKDNDNQLAWAVKNDIICLVQAILYKQFEDGLLSAIKSGKQDLIKYFLFYYDRIGLLFSAAYGRIEIVKIILDYGIDVNTQDDNGYFALQQAAAFNHIDIAKLLIEHGADVNIKDNDGDTVLSECANEKMVKLLLDNGALVNTQNENGFSPLHQAVVGNRSAILELLIAHGADVNMTIINNGTTSLMLAARVSVFNRDVVDMLLAAGADVNRQDESGFTALISATAYGNKELVALLLSNSADANKKDNEGKTALIIAREYGHTEIAELLENLKQ